MGFQVAEGVGGDPYYVCSPQAAEADAAYGVCIAGPDACPGASNEERVISSEEGATWSCTIDLSNEDEITLNFDLQGEGIGLSGTDLVIPFVEDRLVPATCGAFTINDGGDTFSPSECMNGLPNPGTCVVNIQYNARQVTGSFRCLELPGSGSDLLTTLNGTEIGGGGFSLRACEIIE